MANDTAQASVTVFGDMRSGNCWKVRWTLELTATPYRWIETDIMQGASRTDEFLQMNPNGRVPLLQLADGRCLAESNAICWYLAETNEWLPKDRYDRASILQWQCFEQYNHEPNIAVARFIRQFLAWPNDRVDEYHAKQAGGHQALAVMEQHLSDQDWFVGDCLSLADVALYAYTHVADEGGFSLHDYGALRAWLARCAGALPDIRNV